jgi:hypothetical protein
MIASAEDFRLAMLCVLERQGIWWSFAGPIPALTGGAESGGLKPARLYLNSGQ